MNKIDKQKISRKIFENLEIREGLNLMVSLRKGYYVKDIKRELGLKCSIKDLKEEVIKVLDKLTDLGQTNKDLLYFILGR